MSDPASNPPSAATPAMIGLDWGTSSLRAFLMDARGAILTQRDSPHGIQNLPVPGIPGFERAFAGACGEWLDRWPKLPIVAGGMVGSAQGWREAPYVTCPADTHVLASRAVAVEAPGSIRVLLAPGVLYDPPDAPPDVIRGEEIQIAGAMALDSAWARRALVVLPGTHSKWVDVDDGRIMRFHTYMTGELFAVLRKHSILGRLMPDDAPVDDAAAKQAFAAGLAAAKASHAGDLPHQLFATRTLGLTRRLPAEGLADYLSGLLIGHEIVSALARMAPALAGGMPLLLIGDDTLCARYRDALTTFGHTAADPIGNSAPRGLFEFAAAAGLITKDQTS